MQRTKDMEGNARHKETTDMKEATGMKETAYMELQDMAFQEIVINNRA